MTDTVTVVLSLVGGLALFLFGMSLMTDGLRQAVGGGLRVLLARATRNRAWGLVFGTLLGFIALSGPTIIMLIGFVNAGLMTLAQAIPPMLGANLGTSLSMQLVALRIGDYCYAVIALGLVLTLVTKRPPVRHSGRTLLGFGLLFLGLNTSSAAIAPHRETLGRLLALVPLERPLGQAIGLLVAVGWTALLQSSGATIGMCFVLASAGVVTDLRQVFPLVLGAHIGTCLNSLVGSLGTHIEARRVAVGHLVFNVLTVILVTALAPLFYRLLPMLSADLLRQTANLHTFSRLAGVLFFLPLTGAYAGFLRVLVPSRQPPPQASLLDPQLLDYPEKALCAAIAELQRVARLCARSLRAALGVLVAARPRDVRLVKLNEDVIDEIKLAMKDYLTALTGRYLSRRQAILLQHVNRCMADIERIGDHIDALCDVALRQHRQRGARFDRETLEMLFRLGEAAERVLRLVIESLNPEHTHFQAIAQEVLKARDAYMSLSVEIKAAFTERIARHELPPLSGMFFSEYVAALDRIVKHSKSIALAEKQPYFWIKRKKLERLAEEAPEYALPPPPAAEDFLQRLHEEDYL